MKPSSYTLYLGDYIDKMSVLKEHSVDLILTDLPYGTTKCSWDIIIPFEDLWEQYNRIIKPNGNILLFGQEPFSSFLRLSNIKHYKYDIYWEKERLTNIQQVKNRVGKTIETISLFCAGKGTYNPQMLKYEGKRRSNKVKNGTLGKLTDTQNKKVKEYKDTGFRYPTQVWKFNRDCLKSNLHPTQKPVKLLEELIKTFSNEGDVVLDSCMGSSSTGIACLNQNRYFIGIEQDEAFFKIASSRLKEYNEIKT